MNMLYDAMDVAKYIVTYCYENGKPISNLKLQKMMYFTWVDYYRETGNPLFLDDICAWKLGPVVPEVYYGFCPYAAAPIRRSFECDLLSADATIVTESIEKWMYQSASALVNITHKEDGPWSIIFDKGRGFRDVIPFDLIIEKECM